MGLIIDGHIKAILHSTGIGDGRPPDAKPIRHHAIGAGVPAVEVPHQAYVGLEGSVEHKRCRARRKEVEMNAPTDIDREGIRRNSG
jgi:hypothetical protein